MAQAHQMVYQRSVLPWSPELPLPALSKTSAFPFLFSVPSFPVGLHRVQVSLSQIGSLQTKPKDSVKHWSWLSECYPRARVTPQSTPSVCMVLYSLLMLFPITDIWDSESGAQVLWTQTAVEYVQLKCVRIRDSSLSSQLWAASKAW
jgi:hypothetical protein